MDHYDQATMEAAVTIVKFQYQMQHQVATAPTSAIIVNGINIHEYTEVNCVESLINL